MLGGGHISGYAVEGALAQQTAARIAQMQQESGGFFLAVGDGNHSLATAKACWEEIKPTLTAQERAQHPARYALVELVNLHSPAMIFRPIHRVVFSADMHGLIAAFDEAVRAPGHEAACGGGGRSSLPGADMRRGFEVHGRGDRLPVDVLQHFLDAQKDMSLDYVHGEADAVNLTRTGDATAYCWGRSTSTACSRRLRQAACCRARRSPWERARKSGITWSAGESAGDRRCILRRKADQ